MLDQLRECIRLVHYSHRTEEAYVHLCRAFIRVHGIRHPLELGRPEVEAFLGWLAADRQVAASTHKHALSALLFLYTRVLDVRLPWRAEIGLPRMHRLLPVVLSRDEVCAAACGCRFPSVNPPHFPQLSFNVVVRLNTDLSAR